MAPGRPYVITGNWKMYKTYEEAHLFVSKTIPHIQNFSSLAYLAVPFTIIQSLAKEAEGSKLVIGAQNMNDASEGAFTGEISGGMLKDAGAQFVILGHSERRRLFNETDAFINRKVKMAIKVGLQPVLCIGETTKEHESNQAQEIVSKQLHECLAGIKSEDLSRLIIAYEPIWAVGTGKSATPEIAQQMHAYCRRVLGEILTPELANGIVIQYGGSVTPENAEQILTEPDVDGLLIGGASLSFETFSQIIDICESIITRKVPEV